MKLYRATTPVHIFWFCDIDPNANFKQILISYSQNNKIILEKTKTDLEFGAQVIDGNLKHFACVRLTQEETKRFSADPNNFVTIQIRALDGDDNAIASSKIKFAVQDVLNDKTMDLDEGYNPPEDEPYGGSYYIMPTFEDQVLQTNQKLMIDNVTVYAIPLSIVSNIYGGQTAYIGGIYG